MQPLHQMLQTRITKFKAGAPSWLRVPPLPITTAAASGVVGGVALGAVAGPVGVAIGIWLGIGVGIAAGRVITREDAKKSARTRELDAIIGITHGTLGAGVLVKADDDDADDEAPYSDRETWIAEWLTPPPPATR